MPTDNFDKLISRIEIEGLLKNTTQLHIGTASTGAFGEAETVDSPLIRIKIEDDNIPYIPGSSLKGVFRSFIERIASSSGQSVCDPFNHRSACQNNKENQCIACKIFGSQQIASHVYISDAIPVLDFSTHIKPGIGINRVTGSTQRGAFFTVETITPGTEFKFKMIIENLDLFKSNSEEAKLLKLLLKELQSGSIRIGGKTSSGLGLVELKIDKINYLSEDNIKNLSFEYVQKSVSDL
ncbi:MAG: CRISPR-associated RAMP protein [Candidatus Helarchaeota archaeon]|nr:CRISPR-associated RAMP protein [Candidatus Helarchaeota archaeon]